MPNKVSIQEYQDYIRAEVAGIRQSSQEILNSAEEFWANILDLCDQKGVYRLLVVLNLTGDLPTMTGYDLGEWVAKIFSKTSVKVAVVDLNEKSRNINRFIENVAVNRALSPEKAKVFGDEQRAIEWLFNE